MNMSESASKLADVPYKSHTSTSTPDVSQLAFSRMNLADHGESVDRWFESNHGIQEKRKSSEASKRFSFPLALEHVVAVPETQIESQPLPKSCKKRNSAEKHSSMPSGLSIFDTEDPFDLRPNYLTKFPLDDTIREVSFGEDESRLTFEEEVLDDFIGPPLTDRVFEGKSYKKSQDSISDLAAFLKHTGPEDFQEERKHSNNKPAKSSLRMKLPKIFSKGKKSSSFDSTESNNFSFPVAAANAITLRAYSFHENYGPKNALRRISVSSYDSFLYTCNNDGKLVLKDCDFIPRPILKNAPDEPSMRRRSQSMGDIIFFSKPTERNLAHVITGSLRKNIKNEEMSSQDTVTKKFPSSANCSKHVKFVVPNAKDVHYFLDSDAGKAARRTYSLQPAFDNDFLIPTPKGLGADIKRQFLHETFIDSEGFQVSTVYKPGMRPTGEYYKGKPLFYILGSLGTFFLPQESSDSDDFGFNASSSSDGSEA